MSGGPFRIRDAAPADREAWAALRSALWPEGDPVELGQETDAFFRGGLPLTEAVLIAEDDQGRLIGFVELSRRSHAEGCTTSPVGFLEGWFVDPAWRGRGVGRALEQAAEAWARSRGCREFASDTTLENDASAAAHAALGFAEVERLRCFRKPLE